jgi:hypothetical protein
MDRFAPIVDQIRHETIEQRRNLGESGFTGLYVQSLSNRLEEVVTEYTQELIASCNELQVSIGANPVLEEEIVPILKAVAPRMRAIERFELAEKLRVPVMAYRQLAEICDEDPIRQRELVTVFVSYRMMIEEIAPEPAALQQARDAVAHARALIVRAIQEAKDPELMRRRREKESESVRAKTGVHGKPGHELMDSVTMNKTIATPVRKVGISSRERSCLVTVVKGSEILTTEGMSDCVTIAVMLGYDPSTCSYAERRMLHVWGGHLASYHPSRIEDLFQGLQDDDKILVAFGQFWKPESHTASIYTQIIANTMEKHGLPTPKAKQFEQVFTERGILVHSNGTYEVFRS